MSEMVERVAKHMHFRRGNSLRTKWEDCADEYRRGTMRDAHAAIEAMLKPTDEMIKAGRYADNGEDMNLGQDGAEECWRLMIDEALR